MTLLISRTQHAHDPQPNPTVSHCQVRLAGKGYYSGRIDGDFGPASEDATRRFQRHAGITSDGITGKVTLGRLDEQIAYSSVNADDAVRKAFALVTTGLDGVRPRYSHDEVSMSNPSPDALDCSELVQWTIYQITKKTWVDGSWVQAGACRLISVDQAARTPGALLFVSNNGKPSGVHHVAWSRGLGRWDLHGTAEMRSAYMTPNGGSWSIGNRFTFGGLVPVLHY
jgi:cell wall-associated NlpC family hydrolase